MDPAARRRKKIREAKRLQGVTPEESIRSAAQMIEAARRVAEAGDHAQA